MTTSKKQPKESFGTALNAFQNYFDARRVFDDFLTLTMCAVTQIPGEGISHYEDLYLKTIEPYKKHGLCNHFAEALALLIIEMDDCPVGSIRKDVLGTYYEGHISRGKLGQFFTPMHVCELMATLNKGEVNVSGASKRILDPCCGSGRMLLAGAKVHGPHNLFYGIDIDQTCAKMAALNLFLNGIFGGEIMCANALSPDSFEISYKISMLPLGIFRIEDKEASLLWNSNRDLYTRKDATKTTLKDNDVKDNPQLTLF
jgi:type I restriction-modification system DNA methylase subunit